jgi:EAL domain-containing protein (putative c-di-GMP-specific phosphodiesterase class I)
MPLPVLIEAAVPIERDERLMRARRTAARTRIAMGLIGIALVIAQPQLAPHPLLAALGFLTILLTAVMQLKAIRPSWLKVEESAAGLAAVLIIGFGGQHVTVLSILWLAAIASGVMARGGRVHWLGSLIVFAALAMPFVIDQRLSAQYAAVCIAALGLLLTCGRLTRELNNMLRQARRQAENAETLLLAGDIAARMSDRSERAAGDSRSSPPDGEHALSAQDIQDASHALARLINGEDLTMLVQPIVELATGTAHAYEALARFGQPLPERSPLHWFALAEQLGQRPALERACLRAALQLLPQRPDGTSLTVNLSAPVLIEADTIAMLQAAGDDSADELAGLIIEITEETLVHGDMQLLDAIQPLRARGVRLAVDDMGAGYSGLRQITTVHPAYLKLDRSLVTNIHDDPERAALVRALAGYSAQVGSLLIAEGVETLDELQAITALGVPLVQGYYFSRPAPPWPAIGEPYRSSAHTVLPSSPPSTPHALATASITPSPRSRRTTKPSLRASARSGVSSRTDTRTIPSSRLSPTQNRDPA